jgi:putative transposase
MDWKAWLAYITGAVGQELLLRNESLVTENRLLRQQVRGHVHLSEGERKTPPAISKKLGRSQGTEGCFGRSGSQIGLLSSPPPQR